jgi:hypothetical protein
LMAKRRGPWESHYTEAPTTVDHRV